MSDLKEKLSRITVKNGAYPNEERIAQQKIANYAKFMSKEKKQPRVEQTFDDPLPLHEQQFLKEWYELKAANRKRWKVE